MLIFQWLEETYCRPENPCVDGSIPPPGTTLFNHLQLEQIMQKGQLCPKLCQYDGHFLRGDSHQEFHQGERDSLY
jgi:hypothetical protein